jgi:hypothetical protein
VHLSLKDSFLTEATRIITVNKPTRNAKASVLQQETYISLPLYERINRWDGLRALLIATKREPDQCCGHALCIGSVRDFATYRLKVRYTLGKRGVITLPDIFILDGGAFQSLSRCAELAKEEGERVKEARVFYSLPKQRIEGT